jgi:hypothetical protein
MSFDDIVLIHNAARAMFAELMKGNMLDAMNAKHLDTVQERFGDRLTPEMFELAFDIYDEMVTPAVMDEIKSRVLP